MASRSAPPCTHELRPGTTVCLRCQHAERAAKRARQRQLIARGAAGTLVLAVIAAVGVAGATALRARMSVRPKRSPAPDPSAATLADTKVDSVPVEAPSPAPAPNATPVAPRVAPLAAGVAPVVPVGRTPLRDTMIAERAGDTVRVSFDLVLARTRRPEKFEAIVRSTLPQVYGAAADSALRALPVGAVAKAGDLMTMLPQSGFRIPLADGQSIAVWPETRAGRDGPLVVAYRAVAVR